MLRRTRVSARWLTLLALLLFVALAVAGCGGNGY
jgi:hypothetical protein